MIMPKEKQPATPPVSQFSKAQLMDSACYRHRRDLLGVVLKDNQTYSHDDVAKIIERFMEGKVK